MFRIVSVAVRVVAPTIYIYFVLAFPAAAESYSCKCGNGTTCTISCGCVGHISCALDICSGGCGACERDGPTAVARAALGEIFRNNFIVTRGEFDKGELLEVVVQLLAQTPVGVEVKKFKNVLDGEYVLLKSKYGNTAQTLAIPKSLYDDRVNFLALMRQEADTVLGQPDLQLDFLKQFIPL